MSKIESTDALCRTCMVLCALYGTVCTTEGASRAGVLFATFLPHHLITTII